MTPTALSLRLLRSWPGFRVEVVERWLTIPGEGGRPKKIRKDAFGGFDLLAVDIAGRQTWLIQTTSLTNLSSRVKKVRSLPVVADLLRGGIVAECWGWEKRGNRWAVKRVRIEGDSLEPTEVTPRRRRVRRMEQPGLFA